MKTINADAQDADGNSRFTAPFGPRRASRVPSMPILNSGPDALLLRDCSAEPAKLL
jgi:hypothetical protein